MINLIAKLDSILDTFVTEQQCINALDEYVSSDMWRNYKDVILERLGNADFYNERMFKSKCKCFYEKFFANDNYYGYDDRDIQWLLYEKLPPIYLQCFQELAAVHKMIRRNSIYG